ncbi:MAG TPA: TMEM175 family protein [Bryobacteraceae bacterium]|jgi:uncharacterized membrane protein|nr:TMEM175 family protein [Bryobacteraceae bacterium]
MKTFYNRIAGQSLERLAALSDGIFAVAMTLLVLDIHAPAAESVRSEAGLWHALAGLAPRVLMFLMSFLTLGIFWTGQQTQLNHLERVNRSLSWIHLAFLAAVSMMPFSTSLLAEFIRMRLALLVYWTNILVLGAALYASWRYVVHAGLVKDDAPPDLPCAIERRILVAQGLYAAGAALCFIDNRWAIAVIVLVQLNYAFAPKIPFLSRL